MLTVGKSGNGLKYMSENINELFKKLLELESNYDDKITVLNLKIQEADLKIKEVTELIEYIQNN